MGSSGGRSCPRFEKGLKCSHGPSAAWPGALKSAQKKKPGHSGRDDKLLHWAVTEGLAVKVEAQVAELGIERANEGEFFVASPGFELFFAAYGVLDLTKGLKIDESRYVMLLRESAEEMLFVLGDSRFEITGDAYVQDTGGAGEDVNVVDVHGKAVLI